MAILEQCEYTVTGLALLTDDDDKPTGKVRVSVDVIGDKDNDGYATYTYIYVPIAQAPALGQKVRAVFTVVEG